MRMKDNIQQINLMIGSLKGDIREQNLLIKNMNEAFKLITYEKYTAQYYELLKHIDKRKITIKELNLGILKYEREKLKIRFEKIVEERIANAISIYALEQSLEENIE